MIIGLTGHKGAGKNLAADSICSQLTGWKQDAFARPLKDVCATIFGLTSAEMNDPLLKEVPLERYPHQSPRVIMQKLGTEAIRAHWKDAWIEALKCRVRGTGNYVITDVRFQNEADLLAEIGGRIIRVVRPSLVTQATTDLHPSETVLESLHADKVIYNDGSQELLCYRAVAAVLELGEGK